MHTNEYIRSVEAQILGRVFTLNESVHFVLGIDENTGMARCSRSTPNGPGVIYMPVAEVRLWLAEESREREALTHGYDGGFGEPDDDAGWLEGPSDWPDED